MGLKINDSISNELRVTGTQKNGKFIKRQRFYLFKCSECEELISSPRYYLKKHSGLCRVCVDKRNGLLASNRPPREPYRVLYNRFTYDRKRAEQDCDITFEDFLKFTQISTCHYCNESVFWATHALSKNGYRYNLDRKDNSKGYLKDNVVVCCWSCNEMKSNKFTHAEFIEIGKVLKSIREKRNSIKQIG